MLFLAETADEHLVRERKVYQKPILRGSCPAGNCLQIPYFMASTIIATPCPPPMHAVASP